jgi:hypothetical protein
LTHFWPPKLQKTVPIDHTVENRQATGQIAPESLASSLLRAMFDVGYFPPNTPPVD